MPVFTAGNLPEDRRPRRWPGRRSSGELYLLAFPPPGVLRSGKVTVLFRRKKADLQRNVYAINTSRLEPPRCARIETERWQAEHGDDDDTRKRRSRLSIWKRRSRSAAAASRCPVISTSRTRRGDLRPLEARGKLRLQAVPDVVRAVVLASQDGVVIVEPFQKHPDTPSSTRPTARPGFSSSIRWARKVRSASCTPTTSAPSSRWRPHSPTFATAVFSTRPGGVYGRTRWD